MVEQAATEDLFNSDYFFWVDAGSWRWGYETGRFITTIIIHFPTLPFSFWWCASSRVQNFKSFPVRGTEILIASSKSHEMFLSHLIYKSNVLAQAVLKYKP
jgi:hypothetical protein